MHTCSALNNYNELDTIGFEQGSSVFLMIMSMSKVPTGGVKQSEVISEIFRFR